MTLAARLLVAFAIVALLATGLVGISVRELSRRALTADFDGRIEAAASGVRRELAWEAERLGNLLAPLCEHDTFVDKAHLELDRVRGQVESLDDGRRIAFRHLVAEQARAFGLDELVLVTGEGVVLGASEVARIGTSEPRLSALVRKPAGPPRLRRDESGAASMEVHCARSGGGVTVGLVGSRRIAAILDRIGGAYGVRLEPVDAARAAGVGASEAPSVEVRLIDVPEVAGLRVAATVSRAPLVRALADFDRAIAVAGAAALALAIVIAVVLARSLSRPIVALARETREVVAGAPRPVRTRGSREIAELADAFNRSIDELTAMRKRLAVTERIAARREVARQIAHEIKNPLAPIRAAVETLRRLRARDDPAFDDYFEEATSTVLEEVHRIANIVSEFTKFSRLPPPKPEPIDLAAVARGVVTLHASPAEGSAAVRPAVELVAEALPEVVADRDQIVQVLTNLVQNGLEAAGAVRDDPRVVVSLGRLAEGRVRIVVRDNGPGVSAEMLPRLFEPYATSKEKGTGLGLAIVQRIVVEHGGEIAYRTATKGGAVFEIVLPVAGPSLLERPPATGVTA